MSARNVQGRLDYRVNNDADSYELFNNATGMLVAKVPGLEDTRRLAACWNSFVGVPTEGIEAMGGVVIYKGEPVGELATLREQLAAARALLAKARPHINPHAVDAAAIDGPIADMFINTQVRRFLEGGAA